MLQATRDWSDEAWTEAVDRLIDRGLLDPDGTLSKFGAERRQWVEDRTDALALAPYEAIGEDGCEQLRQLARPFSQAIVVGGGLPGLGAPSPLASYRADLAQGWRPVKASSLSCSLASSATSIAGPNMPPERSIGSGIRWNPM